MSAARIGIAIVVVAASTAFAQVRRPIPSFETQVVSEHITPGSSAHLRLKVALPAGLHVQSDKPRDPSLIATALTLTAPTGVSIDRTTYPKATDLPQPGRDEPLAVFSGTFTIDVDVAIASSVRPGTLNIPATLRYQSCTDEVCFPPTRTAVTWRLAVSAR